MIEILQGDCIEQLRTLPDNSVQCCVTSPPYWGLYPLYYGIMQSCETRKGSSLKACAPILKPSSRRGSTGDRHAPSVRRHGWNVSMSRSGDQAATLPKNLASLRGRSPFGYSDMVSRADLLQKREPSSIGDQRDKPIVCMVAPVYPIHIGKAALPLNDRRSIRHRPGLMRLSRYGNEIKQPASDAVNKRTATAAPDFISIISCPSAQRSYARSYQTLCCSVTSATAGYIAEPTSTKTSSNKEKVSMARLGLDAQDLRIRAAA